jgi:DNA-directed RNA polymerase specialized sigma24 family protein
MPADALTNDELTKLYRRYGFLLRRRCRALLRDEVQAEDALQSAFVKIVESK